MKKTVLVNLSDVSRAVGRPAEYLLTFLGQSLNAASKVEKDGDKKMYVAGHHDPKVLQQQTITFVQDFVMCKRCGNPETSCMAEGRKRNLDLILACKSCGARSKLESTNKFVKFMVQHLPQDLAQGHAQTGRGATTDAVDMVSQLVDAEENIEKKKEKRRCPNPRCGHKSVKNVCSKCGTAMHTESHAVTSSHGERNGESTIVQTESDIAALLADTKGEQKKGKKQKNRQCPNPACGHQGSKDVCSKCGTLVINSSHAAGKDESPLMQLVAVIENVTEAVSNECASTTDELQCSIVSKMTSSFLKIPAITDMWGKIDSHDDSMGIIATSIWNAVERHLDTCTVRTKETIVIGVLLCLRDSIEDITDGHVLSGCRQLPTAGVVMRKFLEFLESGSDDESDAE